MSTAVAAPTNGDKQIAKKGVPYLRSVMQGDQFKNALAEALPKHLPPDRFLRVALTCLTRTPKLGDCDPASFFYAMMTLTQLGIEPDGRRAHLIPFGKTVQLIIDYKGIAELVMRSGIVSNLHADVICDKDEFEADVGQIKRHKVNYREPRGEVYAVYAVCRFKDGTEKADIMTKAEVESVRARSRAGKSGPWVTDWNEMAKKTVFRRLSKWLPFSPDLIRAIEAGDDGIIPMETAPQKRVELSSLNEVFQIPMETEAAEEEPSDVNNEDLMAEMETCVSECTSIEMVDAVEARFSERDLSIADIGRLRDACEAKRKGLKAKKS